MKAREILIIILAVSILVITTFVAAIASTIVSTSGVRIFPHQSTIQTVNATTDYFALTCQELKVHINSSIIDKQDTFAPSIIQQNNAAMLQTYEWLFQIKGCQP